VNAFKAHYFDGQSSRMHEVDIARVDVATIHVFGDGIDRTEAIGSLRISPRLARIVRTIEFSDGARVMANDHPLLDQWFPNENRLQRVVDRLERHAQAVAASILICLAMGVVTFVWGVPWMADRIAAQVPTDVEQSLGSEVLGQLDKYGFKPSRISQERQDALSARFATLSSALPDSSHYRLAFRDAKSVGPNALAIPGGTIVITDQLTRLFSDDREFDAVIAHEIGHQQHHHALRQTLRSSFVLVIAALFTGDVSSASTIVVAVPTFLLQSHYSRGFEEEADDFAFATLAAHNTSPAWFASAMRKLDDHYDVDSNKDHGTAYLSSHPSSASRIAAAEASGQDFIALHPEQIRETPGYDPCEEEGICPDEDDSQNCDGDECIDPDEADENADGEDAPDPGSCDKQAVENAKGF
jgi:Zn-dependent protease with chaperone function